MYIRTIEEILDVAVVNALRNLRDMPKKVPKKYEYKENLKSRKCRK